MPPPVERYVVSFTTSPTRILKCREMLDSILAQTQKADLVVLNVPDIFSRTGEKYEVPEKIENQIEINYCGLDWGPATKLVPTVEWLNQRGFDADNTWIIYLDDDRIYPPEMIRSFANAEDKHCIWCARGFDYVNTIRRGKDNKHGVIRTFAAGFGGVCVKLSIFKEDFLGYMDTCVNVPAIRFSDDLVLSNYFYKTGVPIKVFNRPGVYSVHDIKKTDYMSENGLYAGIGGIPPINERYLKAIEELDHLNKKYFPIFSSEEERWDHHRHRELVWSAGPC